MLNPLIQLKITCVVCSFFAILTTVNRLWMRRDRFWWDDAFAFLSMLVLLVQIAAVFLHVPDPRTLDQTTKLAAYYIMAMSFYCIIWFARLSILFSIIRIDPNPRGRRNLHFVAVAFGIILVVMLTQLFWVCEPLHAWKHAVSPQCPLDKQVAICQLVTDIISDSLLLIAPLRVLQAMQADTSTRRRLMFIFSTSVITTIVSLVHAAFILQDGGIKVVIAALVENCVSLMVCNVPVLATALLRIFGAREDSEPDVTQRSSGTFNTKLRFRSLKGNNNNSAKSAGRATTTMGIGRSTTAGRGVESRAITLTGLSSMSDSTGTGTVTDGDFGFGRSTVMSGAGVEDKEDEDKYQFRPASFDTPLQQQQQQTRRDQKITWANPDQP